jgi:hypothetical protein
MLSPLKRVLREYKSLVVKMHMDVPKNKLIAKNVDLMCDLELVFGLPCILPMLEVVHKLIKYIQRGDVFICDFPDTMRSTEFDIYQLYVNPFCKYDDSIFSKFIVVYEHHIKHLPFVWATHENETNFYCLQFFAFDIGD